MEEMLRQYDYRNDLHENEWRKKNWTIRIGLEAIEAFNTPRINTPGLYYMKKFEELDLKFLLDEIEKLIK